MPSGQAVMTPLWIGVTALAFGIMAGSLSLLCVFALEVEGGRRKLAPRRNSSEGRYRALGQQPVPRKYATAHPQQRDNLLA